MFVNERLVFVELHKTGGTHIGKWLARLVGGEQLGKHNRVPPDLRSRFVIGSVRSPWDWYVSLWAYGCEQKGSVFHQVTRRTDLAYLWHHLGPELCRDDIGLAYWPRQFAADLVKPAREWRKVYRSAVDAGAFRAWLHMVHEPSRRFDLAEGYGFSPVSRWAGLLTYRYLKLFSSLDESLYENQDMGTLQGTLDAWRKHRIVRYVIRNEQLEVDLLDALALAGFKIGPEQRQALLSARREKTNASTRMATEHYYDRESIALVARRDELIIREHGYRPPGSAETTAASMRDTPLPLPVTTARTNASGKL